MKYRLGNSKWIKECGETTELVCPKCDNAVKFSVFSNPDTRLVAKFPLVDFKNIYLLVCPECSATFTVDTSKGKTFKKGEPLAIGNYDLKELEKFGV